MVAGKVVIVTGGAKGLGRFIAGTFVDAQAKVVISDIDAAALAVTVKELGARTDDAVAVETDVRDEVQVERMVAQTVERFGRVDVLINNAAIVTHSHVW